MLWIEQMSMRITGNVASENRKSLKRKIEEKSVKYAGYQVFLSKEEPGRQKRMH